MIKESNTYKSGKKKLNIFMQLFFIIKSEIERRKGKN